MLSVGLKAGLEQFRLIRAEKELLEETLRGSIKVLGEILSIIDPDAFGKSMGLRQRAGQIATALEVEKPWEIEVAAMLAKLGKVTIPSELREMQDSGQELSATQLEILDRIPEIGSDLIGNIPRLEEVARIVHFQGKQYDGSGFPEGGPRGMEIPEGSRILKAVSDLAELEGQGHSTQQGLETMEGRSGWYDPRVLRAMHACFGPQESGGDLGLMPPREVTVEQLRPGMLLASSVETQDGKRLIGHGHRINAAMLEKIRNYATMSGVQEPILVEDRVGSALEQVHT